jgi:hypothetical protein
MDEHRHEITVSLNEEQYRVAARVARERGFSINGLVQSIVSVVLMTNWRHGDAPQPAPDLNKSLRGH